MRNYDNTQICITVMFQHFSIFYLPQTLHNYSNILRSKGENHLIHSIITSVNLQHCGVSLSVQRRLHQFYYQVVTYSLCMSAATRGYVRPSADLLDHWLWIYTAWLVVHSCCISRRGIQKSLRMINPMLAIQQSSVPSSHPWHCSC